MKKLICTMIITIITTFANTNHYDLTVGTIRYYDDCRSYGSICVAAYQYWGIEEIVGDILINDKIYSIVNWKSKTIYWDSITNNEETSYYRFADGLLYKFTSTGDSILQNFNFTKGDSLINFFQDFKSLPSITNPPSVAIYDTIVDFCDGSKHRIIWGDDTLHLFGSNEIPNSQIFCDSVLIDKNEVWTLPFGETDNYTPYKPFYFIDSIGVIYSEWNYRKMALIGMKTSKGKQYGQELELITSINDETQPSIYDLYQNYPNPFNPATMINYQLPMTSEVNLSVFNMLGQKIATLVNERKSEGSHQVIWDASTYPSGIYFYMIEAGDFVENRKCLLVK